jgi:3',5'-nucleoside bisphosphate phosphatase
MDFRRADLHTHTRHSDGKKSPEELVRMVREKGVTVLAVTDHDSIDAFPEASKAGKRHGVHIVPGVELSASVGRREVHLLGYFFDPENERLRRRLVLFAGERRVRVESMVKRLNDLGVELDLEAVFEEAGGGIIGRPHVASALVDRGLASSIQDAFARFLADNGPANVARPFFDAEEAIALIHEAGGVVVLAHPGNWMRRETILTLVEQGLDGIEVVHPSHDATLSTYYREFAQHIGLLPAGGSDYHGRSDHEDAALGRFTVPIGYVSRLHRKACSLYGCSREFSL